MIDQLYVLLVDGYDSRHISTATNNLARFQIFSYNSRKLLIKFVFLYIFGAWFEGRDLDASF
jgi:hypothetical protein